MGILETLLETIPGDVKLLVTIRKKEAAEIFIKSGEIVVDIKNPLLAIEATIRQLKNKEHDSHTIKRLKNMDFKIRIKYKGVQFTL